jgi:hypothetical protein
MQAQATRCTQKELADMAYWQKPESGGHHFPRGAVIPESTTTPPQSWSLPTRTVLAVSAVMLAISYAILWVAQ